MERYEHVLRPRLTQYRRFFQKANLYYVVAATGLINIIAAFVTYCIFNAFGYGSWVVLLTLITSSGFDCFFSWVASFVSISNVPKVIEFPAWKKELYVYSSLAIYHFISPAGRLWLSLLLVTLGTSQGHIVVAYAVFYFLFAGYILTSIFFIHFINEVTFVVELLRDTTPSDRDLA